MSRTAEKVETLLSEDPAMATALETVLEQTAGGTGEVEWKDVRDDLTSGQWGRLIEKGVLTDGTEGFTLSDPEAVRAAVDWEGDGGTTTTATTSTPSTTDDGEGDSGGEGWSTWDKLAALATVGLFAGYSLASVRSVIGGAIDLLLGPLDAALPFYIVILVLATFTGFYSTLLQAHLMDMDTISKYQERMKDIQERQKAAKERGDDEALDQIRQEQMDAMGDQLGMFKAQFRPMVWIMLLTIPVFLWMYWKILPQGTGAIVGTEKTVVMPLVGPLNNGWTQGVIGPIQAWIVWYFVCSMAITQVIRKSLNIQTSPT